MVYLRPVFLMSYRYNKNIISTDGRKNLLVEKEVESSSRRLADKETL